MVAVKEFQEAGLSAGRSLHSPKAEIVPGALKVTQIHHQILYPQTTPLTHRRQLGWPDKIKYTIFISFNQYFSSIYSYSSISYSL